MARYENNGTVMIKAVTLVKTNKYTAKEGINASILSPYVSNKIFENSDAKAVTLDNIHGPKKIIAIRTATDFRYKCRVCS